MRYTGMGEIPYLSRDRVSNRLVVPHVLRSHQKYLSKDRRIFYSCLICDERCTFSQNSRNNIFIFSVFSLQTHISLRRKYLPERAQIADAVKELITAISVYPSNATAHQNLTKVTLNLRSKDYDNFWNFWNSSFWKKGGRILPESLLEQG